MPFTGRPLELTTAQRSALRALVQSSSSPVNVVVRAQIVWLLAAGSSYRSVAETLHVSRPTIARWKQRFLMHGLDGLTTRRSGRPVTALAARQRARVLAATDRPPRRGQALWSCRRLARHLGVSKDVVHRIWRRANRQPWRGPIASARTEASAAPADRPAVSPATRERQARFIRALIACACNISKACVHAEISRQTVYRWFERDETYRDHYERAQQIVLEDLEGVLFTRAQTSDRLLEFVLKHHFPETYGGGRRGHRPARSSEVGRPAAWPSRKSQRVKQNLKNLTDEERETLLRLTKTVVGTS